MVYYLKLYRAFFDHSKIDLLTEKHGPGGALCLLFIWSEMMLREGIFDSNNEHDLVAAARRCSITTDQVKEIIQTCVKVNLLTPQSKKGTFRKDRIDKTLDELNKLSNSGKAAGVASGISRRNKSNDRSTNVKPLLNETERNTNGRSTTILHHTIPNESKTTEGSSFTTTGEVGSGTPMSATVGPLWGLLAVKVGLKADDRRVFDLGAKEFVIIENHRFKKKIERELMEVTPAQTIFDDVKVSLQKAIKKTEIENEPEELP